MRRIILCDLKPVAFQLETIALQQENPLDALETLVRLYHRNGGLIARPDESVYVVWVADHKVNGNYWRHTYLRDTKGLEYKDGRSPNPSINKVVDTMRSLLPANRIVSYPGFEADDVISKIVQQFEGKYFIDILTCDTDLLQLVDQFPKGDGFVETRWIDTMKYQPIIRDLHSSLVYLERKYLRTLTHPREIVDLKIELGDRSDSLPVGTERGLIDLRNPIVECPYVHKARPLFRPIHLGEILTREPIQYWSPHAPILNPSSPYYVWR